MSTTISCAVSWCRAVRWTWTSWAGCTTVWWTWSVPRGPLPLERRSWSVRTVWMRMLLTKIQFIVTWWHHKWECPPRRRPTLWGIDEPTCWYYSPLVAGRLVEWSSIVVILLGVHSHLWCHFATMVILVAWQFWNGLWWLITLTPSHSHSLHPLDNQLGISLVFVVVGSCCQLLGYTKSYDLKISLTIVSSYTH